MKGWKVPAMTISQRAVQCHDGTPRITTGIPNITDMAIRDTTVTVAELEYLIPLRARTKLRA